MSFSGAAARGFYDTWSSDPDAEGDAQNIADLLRTAYAGEASVERIAAMHDFWSRDRADKGPVGPGGVDYAALPVIARAAATVKAENIAGDDTPWLIAAMLSSGYDGNAARWSEIAESLSGEVYASVRGRCWRRGRRNRACRSVFRGSAISSVRTVARTVASAISLVAALAGLDRIPSGDRARLLQEARIDPSPQGKWARAIMRQRPAGARRGPWRSSWR